MTVVLVNGPPRSGKDHAARLLTGILDDAIRIGFADPLKRGTHASYGLTPDPIDQFEVVKDQPREEFFGLTPRKAYIAHSEQYMKVMHGPRVFGLLFLAGMRRAGRRITIVPDSGFYDEALPVVEEVGPENVLLIRLHAEGRGKTFVGDSRGYIRLPSTVTQIDLENNGSVAEFERELLGLAPLIRGMGGGI